jgi:hypothetical protein
MSQRCNAAIEGAYASVYCLLRVKQLPIMNI